MITLTSGDLIICILVVSFCGLAIGGVIGFSLGFKHCLWKNDVNHLGFPKRFKIR